MNPASINWLAVIAATLSAFAIGGLWYSAFLFGKAWMRVSGVSEEKAKSSNMLKIYGTAFLFILIAALNLAFFLSGPSITAGNGAFYGFLTGFGWVFMGIGVIALFEQRSWTYIFINGFYWVVSLTVMGLILGAWK
jgi:hypothetical protein